MEKEYLKSVRTSLPNFRPVIENCIEGTSKRNPHKLYRSSRPDYLTADEIEVFQKLGIRCIIDFRSQREYKKKASGNKLLDHLYPPTKVKLPSKYKANEPVRSTPGKMQAKYKPPNIIKLQDGIPRKHYLINFFNINYIWVIYNRAPWYLKLYSILFLIVDLILGTGYKNFVRVFAKYVLNKEGLVGQYFDMINYSQTAICSALKLLTDEENIPAMLNCAHGKDRTGIVSALILSLFGWSKADIAHNYSLSEQNLAGIKDQIYKEIVEHFHMCESFTSTKADTMMKVLVYIEEHYGSVPNYLESIGFSRGEQEKLKQILSDDD